MANKLILAALVIMLTGCDLRPHQYIPSPWANVAFDEAKAKCSAQMDRDMDRTENLQSAFNMGMDTGPRLQSCLKGYGYVPVN